MEYSFEDAQKIIGPNGHVLSMRTAHKVLDVESGRRPRIYGIARGTNQIQRIPSIHKLDQHSWDLIWKSGTTIADIIQ